MLNTRKANSLAQRRAISFTFAVITGVVVLASAAYACTAAKGTLTATGGTGSGTSQTVAANNSYGAWCLLQTGFTAETTTANDIRQPGIVHLALTPFAGSTNTACGGVMPPSQWPNFSVTTSTPTLPEDLVPVVTMIDGPSPGGPNLLSTIAGPVVTAVCGAIPPSVYSSGAVVFDTQCKPHPATPGNDCMFDGTSLANGAVTLAPSSPPGPVVNGVWGGDYILAPALFGDAVSPGRNYNVCVSQANEVGTPSMGGQIAMLVQISII